MKKGFVVIAIVLAVLHQDAWLWNNASLVFDFLPVGLAYHALYSIVVGGFWAWVVFSAWPEEPEISNEGGPEAVSVQNAGDQP